MRFQLMFSWWLIALIGTSLIVWLIWRTIKILKEKRPLAISAPRIMRSTGIVICLIIMMVGISVPGGESQAGMSNIDAVIAIDRTASISAEDYDNNKPRLEGVKRDVLEIVKALQGARIALVTFDSEARVRVPFTTDSSAIVTAITVLDQEGSYRSIGSSIDLPLDASVSLLKKSTAKYPEKGRLFFYLGDGEQTADQNPREFSAIKPLVDGGAILGYGTEMGGRMKSYSGYKIYEVSMSKPYIVSPLDMSGSEPALSKINEPNLRAIANQTGLKYSHRVSLNQSVQDVVRSSKMQSVADDHRQISSYVNLYWIFAAILAGLLIWWLLDILTFTRSVLKREVS